MKKHLKILRILIPILFMFSCDWPETIVTNFVHKDGSVTRRVVMKNNKEFIDPVDYRVPVDSTWNLSKSFELREKDTIWIFTYEKHFTSVDEINRDYERDGGSNKMLIRNAGFTKKFSWFYTRYHYSEKIGRILNVELKAEDYFNNKELEWFYMQGSRMDSLLNTADSIIYKEQIAMADSTAKRYLLHALVREWASNYLKLVPDSAFINARKDLIIEPDIDNNDQDSIFITVLGDEYYIKNKVAIDSALAQLESTYSKALSSRIYTLETVMPGSLISSNGFRGKDGKVSWAVDSKYYVSQNYIMLAESKTVNYWFWLITVFLVILIFYIILKPRQKS